MHLSDLLLHHGPYLKGPGVLFPDQDVLEFHLGLLRSVRCPLPTPVSMSFRGAPKVRRELKVSKVAHTSTPMIQILQSPTFTPNSLRWDQN